VQRGSWYMVSTDPRTLWTKLETLRDATNDPQSAGLEMWQGILEKLGKGYEAAEVPMLHTVDHVVTRPSCKCLKSFVIKKTHAGALSSCRQYWYGATPNVLIATACSLE
jgi:hypothetical protein